MRHLRDMGIGTVCNIWPRRRESFKVFEYVVAIIILLPTSVEAASPTRSSIAVCTAARARPEIRHEKKLLKTLRLHNRVASSDAAG